MKLHFRKMSGAGNDFVVIDASGLPGTIDWPRLAPTICDRRNGIGADGIVVIRDHPDLDAEMLYFNADGSTGSMCGNGGRCAALYVMARTGKPTARFAAVGETFQAVQTGSRTIKLTLPAPATVKLDQSLDLEGRTLHYHFVDSGSPHAVFFTEALPQQYQEEIETAGIRRLGALVRHHQSFRPGGTNANFIRGAEGFIIQRTYERGVEDETLACGTGAIAVATVAILKAGYRSPVRIHTRGGEDLVATWNPGASHVDLEGGATFVYEGEMEID